jgi:hypothetical protein
LVLDGDEPELLGDEPELDGDAPELDGDALLLLALEELDRNTTMRSSSVQHDDKRCSIYNQPNQ